MRNVAVGIIVIVVLLLVARHYVKSQIRVTPINVRQTAQLHAIDAALELFSNDFHGSPPSRAVDDANRPYCGAMKLAEARWGGT